MSVIVKGGGGKPEEEKTVTAGTSVIEVSPSSGKVMKKVTINPTPTETKEVSPTVTDQTYNPPEGKHFSQFTVKGDSDLIAENIKEGVNIFGVDGCLTELPIEYEYTGTSNMEFTVEPDSKGGSILTWQLKLLTSGTLKITKLLTDFLDVFLVGGGGGGSNCSYGGGGGYTVCKNSINISKNNSYPIVIGAGGSGGASDSGWYGGTPTSNPGSAGGDTTAFGFTAKGGKGATTSKGGSGGSGGGGGGTGQGTTTRAFETGDLYSGGGGAGSHIGYESGSHTSYPYSTAGGSGGSDGSDGLANSSRISSYDNDIAGSGGSGGGGSGGFGKTPQGSNGTVNTGGGGGGGRQYDGERNSSRPNGQYSAGGSGGSGIVILRGRYS